jgi:ribosomal protein S12 methylthiotransferase
LAELVFKDKFTPSVNPKYTKLTPSHYSYLKISEGCDNWCAFCTIPKIRGKHVSKSVEDVVKDAKLQISLGAKELLLIAEDTTAWGEDIYGTPSFHILLEELAKLDVTWIRPMYIFPSRVTDELIEVMAKNKTISNYIDMPIQHVSTHLLESMNRRHDKAFLEKVLTDFRTAIPDIAIRTSFILGYPGETEQDVDDLVAFIEKYPFAHIGCFGYSVEKDTRAAKLDNKIAPDVIRKRIERVMNRQHELVLERNKKRIGVELDIVVDRSGFGRSEYEAPEVDGGIMIETDKGLIPGHVYKGTITDAKGYDLVAKV